MSAFIAAEGMPELEKLLWILVCMVGARSAAMAFNRIMDARFDMRNPRTQGRAIPSGQVDVKSYWLFLIVSSAIFIFAAGMLNLLALYLSPVALVIVFFYSLTKRFTAYSHFWLVGFDILYSCMDVNFDRDSGLKSIPQKFGVENALRISFASHGLMILFLLILLQSVSDLGILYFAGVVIVGGLLIYEHSLVRPDDLSKINVAFFNMNGIISIGLMVFVVADCVWV